MTAEFDGLSILHFSEGQEADRGQSVIAAAEVLMRPANPLEGETELTAQIQLSANSLLLDRLGFRAPRIAQDSEAHQNISETAARQPGLRLIVAPVLTDYWLRAELIQRGRELPYPPTTFRGQTEIVLPSTSSQQETLDKVLDRTNLYGDLLAIPAMAIRDADRKYSLGYVSNREIVNRTTYLSFLQDHHKVLQSDEGVLFSYTFIDPRAPKPTTSAEQALAFFALSAPPQENYSRPESTLAGIKVPLLTEQADDLFKQGLEVSPETLLLRQYMLLLSGDTIAQNIPANEAVISSRTGTAGIKIEQVSGISWSTYNGKIRAQAADGETMLNRDWSKLKAVSAL
jgi:hypothetical protein